MTWTKEVPTEVGLYYFYGKRNSRSLNPDLYMVRVRGTADPDVLVFVEGGGLMFHGDHPVGCWCRMPVPDLPSSEEWRE